MIERDDQAHAGASHGVAERYARAVVIDVLEVELDALLLPQHALHAEELHGKGLVHLPVLDVVKLHPRLA